MSEKIEVTYEQLIEALERAKAREEDKPGLPHFNNASKIERMLFRIRRRVFRKTPVPDEVLSATRTLFAAMGITLDL